MADEDSDTTALAGVSTLVEIVKVAADSPEGKAAAANLGRTAVTLTQALNNALLPLAAVNFAFDKARKYFSGKFQQDLAEKTAAIPSGHIVEPKASVAGPALQGLAFTHEEPDLKEMYLNLLVTAMDARVSEGAHPAFVEVIKQLNGDEANLLRGILKASSPLAIVQIRAVHTSGVGKDGYTVLLRHVLPLRDSATRALVENVRLAAMVDNWIRLGLVEVAYDLHLTGPDSYAWADQRPEFLRLSVLHGRDERNVEFAKGIIARTEFGKQFAEVIGVLGGTG